jgi:hypothetical protein
VTLAENLAEQNKILITNFCKEYTGVELATEEAIQAFIDHQRKIEVIEKLKAEMKAMKVQMNECSNADYLCGYISAISTIEGYIAELESKGSDD